jgi:putative endonuclease
MIPVNDIWYVYIVSCRDRTLYTGITNNPERRLREHNSTQRGARYTRGRRPVTLIYLEHFPTRSAASKREHLIKKMPVAMKNRLLYDHPDYQSQTDIFR